MVQIEKLIFKYLGLLPFKFKPLSKVIVYPIISGIAILVGYIGLCFTVSRLVSRLIVNKL